MSDVIAYFDSIESELCLRMNRFSRRRWVRRLFAVVSRLGDGGFWAAMALVLLGSRGPKAAPVILCMALTGAAGLLLYRFLKSRLVRERPYVSHGDILCGAAPLDRYSFPSGHTLHAVNFATTISVSEPLLAPLAVAFAGLVAASRVILGLHYPSDVIAGGAIGLLLSAASLVWLWS